MSSGLSSKNQGGYKVARCLFMPGCVGLTKKSTRTVYQRLHVHGRSMYVIGAKRAPDSCEISILEIDPADGRILADYMPPNNGVKCSENLFVSSDADQAFLYWNGIARAYRHHLGRPAEAEEVEEVGSNEKKGSRRRSLTV